MNVEQWLKDFRRLHELAKRGPLPLATMREYRAARNDLSLAILGAQHVAVPPDLQPWHALRVARVLQADIAFFDREVRVATRSISCRGLSVVLALPPKVGEEVQIALRIPEGEPLQGRARAIESKSQMGSALAWFEWGGLAPPDVARLEAFVLDTVLEQLEFNF